jgi:pyrroloquinoline quinone biosynthesis protein E
VLQVHLSGGEPPARRDLVEITAGARAAGLYTNLITSGGRRHQARLLDALATPDSIMSRFSIQDSEPTSADRIAGYEGAFARSARSRSR